MIVTKSTTMNDIRTAVLTWVRDVTGRDIVLKYDSELHKPTRPYVEIYIVQAPTGGGRTLTLEIVDDEPVEVVSTTCIVAVTLNIYGGDAMDAAYRIRNSVYATNRYADLFQILGLTEVVSLIDLTSLETGHYKQRAELIINFNARIEDSFTSAYYDTVEATINREQ